jgi:hypothetical protein
MLDRNRLQIGEERRIGSLVATALAGHASVHKLQKGFTYPNASFEQYTFVLSISTFDMKPLLSCTSNAILDRDRPQIGGERWIGNLVATALAISPQQAQKILHILMTYLINTD